MGRLRPGAKDTWFGRGRIARLVVGSMVTASLVGSVLLFDVLPDDLNPNELGFKFFAQAGGVQMYCHRPKNSGRLVQHRHLAQFRIGRNTKSKLGIL